MILDKISSYGGVYSETTAVRHILSYHGVVDTHGGNPISEAMLFGISGGIGFAYFNFEYEGYEPTLYIGTAQRYKTRFGQYMANLYKRLGLEINVKLTKSAQQAEADLLNDLAHERPALLHVDRGYLPYYAEDSEYGDHALVVLGHDDKSHNFIVADQSKVPLFISPDDLADARGAITSLSYRSLTIAPP
ncbi:MAG: BtrH N-terminal domain-containing protein, partial [Candidatus Marinimicrobia bacterium]|nr:BtrH N-terminal domain-containing protein [Candidatus Neomarinimicrobiota bacterium]